MAEGGVAETGGEGQARVPTPVLIWAGFASGCSIESSAPVLPLVLRMLGRSEIPTMRMYSKRAAPRAQTHGSQTKS